jgi:hypothetical protein
MWICSQTVSITIGRDVRQRKNILAKAQMSDEGLAIVDDDEEGWS